MTYSFFCLLLRDVAFQKRFLDADQKVFEVWEYTSIVYVPTPSFFFTKENG